MDNDTLFAMHGVFVFGAFHFFFSLVSYYHDSLLRCGVRLVNTFGCFGSHHIVFNLAYLLHYLLYVGWLLYF